MGIGGMMMIGASMASFGYLTYKISDMNRNKAAYMAEG